MSPSTQQPHLHGIWDGEAANRIAILQTALEHMDEGFTIYSQDLRLLAWNARFFELLDLPLELAFIGAKFEDFIRFNAERGDYGPCDPEEFVAERCRVARTFVPHCFQRARPNGTVLEVRGNPIPGIGFVTVYTDVTQRIQDQQAQRDLLNTLERRVAERTAELSEATERIRLIADAVPVLIGYVDSASIYRFANRHYEEWLGLPIAQLIGRKVGDVMTRPLYQEQPGDLKSVREGKRVQREISFIKPGGQHMEAVMNYLPHTADGNVVGYFILGQDITESKRAEANLRHAQKMEAVGQLTSGMAHDFNNLLTIIMGNLALVRETAVLSGDEGEMVDETLDATRRGANLVKRLLAFSRRRPLRLEVYDPYQAVADMYSLLARTLGDDIDLIIEGPSRSCLIESDPSELENAVLNQAINGRDAMPNGGRLVVRIDNTVLADGSLAKELSLPAGEYVLVSVTDNGCGMTAEVRERAFEPFYTSKAQGSGTGLGLSMVYGFAQRSGGATRILSTPGHGTTIEMYLPHLAVQSAETMSKTRRSVRLPTGHETVLLVEDDNRVRTFVRRSLAQLGYTVRDVATGREALDLLQAGGRWNLVISDIETPGGVSGVEVAQAMERHYPECRLLLMSGNLERAMERADVWETRWPVLPKPFEKKELAVTVRRVLDGGESETA